MPAKKKTAKKPAKKVSKKAATICVIPALALKNAHKALEHYKKAFGAVETHKLLCPQTGVIAHAGLKIGESEIYLSEENPECGSIAAENQSFYIRVPNVDEVLKKAVKLGFTQIMPATDMFWGDRMGTVSDAYGLKWSIATHVRDVSPKEMQQAMKQMSSGAKKAA